MLHFTERFWTIVLITERKVLQQILYGIDIKGVKLKFLLSAHAADLINLYAIQ
ncbi:hypothetical protein D3C73_1557560 [compost metagenome]